MRPRVLILPYWQARHPDHATASVLGYEAAFLAQDSAKLDLGAPSHRPFKIVYASLYADVRPTFVVDISEQFETRFAALMAYRSQYQDQSAGSGLFPRRPKSANASPPWPASTACSPVCKYAEPFVQKEIGLVDDLLRFRCNPSKRTR